MSGPDRKTAAARPTAPVFIAGGYQTDFARHLAREALELSDLVRETTLGTLEAAAISPGDIDAIHVGNAFAELFTGQAHLGAMPATVCPELWGLPATRHEAACASGSVALLAAMAEIEAGRHDCVLVLGVEQERNVPGELAARHMGSAAWVGHEGQEDRFLWPAMFSRIADVLERRGGLRTEHLAAIARKNLGNARKNPRAQTRSWSHPEGAFDAAWSDDTGNPPVEGRLRRRDCGQVTDGAAGLVVTSAAFAEAHTRRTGRALASVPRILGWGHRTAGLSLDEKLRRRSSAPSGPSGTASATEAYLLPHLRQAVVDAYARAGLAGPEALDGFEVHDCFTVTEYLVLDHLGITAPGESWKAIEEGALELGGRLPVNPSGGLIGLGHPVGATGVRMVLDAARQVSGTAGEYQVDGARRFGTFNIGGSATTVVAFVVGSGDDARA